jgi:hypothetical protein
MSASTALGKPIGWCPRPDPNGTDFNNRAYLAGYDDGFYGREFGHSDPNKYGAFSAYRPGFDQGSQDYGRHVDQK